SQGAARGGRRAGDKLLPMDSMPAPVVLPLGRFGPTFLAYDNFQAYLKWNQSLNYSLTAAYYATRLDGAPAMNRGSPNIPKISFEETRELQQILEKRGYDVGRVDGVLGLKSRVAIRDAQIKFGLPADGWPTAELLAQLRRGRYVACRRTLTHNSAQHPQNAFPLPHSGQVAAQPRIETEAAPGAMQREEKHHHRKEYVRPRPLRGTAGPINAEPQVQHEYDAEHADQTHAEPENERHGKGELGKKDDGIEDIEIGKIDRGHQLAMKLERSTVGHLFGPVLQAARDRQRQLPQHPLKPHSPHQHAHEPSAKVRSRPLGGVLLPVLDGDHDARGDERQEQRNQEIFPRAESVVVVVVPDHQIPEIRERVWHGDVSGEPRGSARIRASVTPLNSKPLAGWLKRTP